jgi:hypothetical protein
MARGHGHGEKLSRKREQAIAALLTAATVEAAAAAAGVGERTLRGWMQQPAFSRAYQDARRLVVETALTRLQQVSGDAVETLRRNLTCKKPAAEIRAALGILDLAVRAVEIGDLAQRVEELEGLISERSKGNDRGTTAAGAEDAANHPAPPNASPDTALHSSRRGGFDDTGRDGPGPLADDVAPLAL